MDHSLSSEEDGAQHSTAQSDEESVSLLQLQRAIADDLSNYQCFVKPFHSVDKEKQEQSKVENTPSVRVGQQEINSTGNEVCEIVSNYAHVAYLQLCVSLTFLTRTA